MSEFPDTELSRRLRANRGRRLRPQFNARIEKALGYRPNDDDFLDIRSTDKLVAQLPDYLERTWPESEWLSLRARLNELAAKLGKEHSSYLVFFEDWEYLGALRVPSAVLLESAQSFWKPGWEALGLVTDKSRDGFWLDYTDPDRSKAMMSTNSAAGANSALSATPNVGFQKRVCEFLRGRTREDHRARRRFQTGHAAGRSRSRRPQRLGELDKRSPSRSNDYDTLAPGSSRREYLVLLHKLQRDCPQVADEVGLTGAFLPRCSRLDQENCTMYRRP
jgi:hypothetical protein